MMYNFTLDNNNRISQWNDLYENDNHATPRVSSSKPLFVENVQNSLGIIRYDGNGKDLIFLRQTNIRTLFVVLKEDDNTTHAWRPILADISNPQSYPFHRGVDKKIFGQYTSSKVTNGETRINGNVIDPTNILMPTIFSVLSIKTTDNVSASNISAGLGISARAWDGDFAEFISYSTELTDSQIESVNNYLKNKWGI